MNLAEFVSASALLKRNWFWVALLLLCALISSAVFVAPARIGRIELEREAKIAATRIGATANPVRRTPQIRVRPR